MKCYMGSFSPISICLYDPLSRIIIELVDDDCISYRNAFEREGQVLQKNGTEIEFNKEYFNAFVILCDRKNSLKEKLIQTEHEGAEIFKRIVGSSDRKLKIVNP